MIALTGLRTKAERLLALHEAPPILVLPNAWDVASARIFASTPGCKALATTSGGVAAVLGYPDGEAIPRELMLEAVARIAGAVGIPVTADLEAGYGDSPEAAARTARAALAAGAVGINLEDGTGAANGALVDPALHADKIRAAREEAGEVHLVINARVDVYLRGVGDPAERLEHAAGRARAYRRAGADCIFVPGVTDSETIARLVEAIDAPLNILARPEAPPVAELESLGVARVSIGSGGMRASAAVTRRVADELLGRGTFSFAADALPSGELERILSGSQ